MLEQALFSPRYVSAWKEAAQVIAKSTLAIQVTFGYAVVFITLKRVHMPVYGLQLFHFTPSLFHYLAYVSALIRTLRYRVGVANFIGYILS